VVGGNMKLKYRLRNIVHKIKKAKAIWIGHILLGKGHLQHFIEGKLEGDSKRRNKT